MEWIESIDDPRVAAYRNLPERTLRGQSIFLAEGRLVTKRLLQSQYEAQSVFVAEQFAEEFQQLVRETVPLYVAPEHVLMRVVGFKFHLGVLAAGRRRPPMSLDDLMKKIDPGGPVSLVVCPEVTKPENLGLVFRSAAAFGIDGVLLGRQCCDPFSRRCLRVSMGAVLWTPVVRSEDLRADLHRLKEHWAVELVATVVDPQADRLAGTCWPARAGLLLGSEFDGLRPQWLSLCDRRLTIPMHPAADSLNLGVAAGIFLYEWKGRTLQAPPGRKARPLNRNRKP